MDWSRKVHEPFVAAALGIALTAGFGYGAWLVAATEAGVRLGGWYAAMVQAHGQAQLFGWVGLFVLGMGLYFLPRLRGTTLKGIGRGPWALGLLAGGIALRCLVQPLAGWAGTNDLLRALFLLSGLLAMAGMVVVVSMLAATERKEKRLSPDAPAYAVEPFAQLAFLSLTFAYLFNLFGVWNAVSEARSVVAPRYDQTVIALVLYGVAIPMAMVFSIRSLPVFLYLVPPTGKLWRSLALFYFVGLALRLAPNVLAMADDALLPAGRQLRANFINVALLDALAVAGVILMNAIVLLYVWRLGLWRQRAARTPLETDTGAAARRKEMRRGIAGGRYPDHGEYGRFELLIYAAFAWLVVAAILDLLRALPALNEMVYVPADAARHALTVGFITLLIFGMAVRMLPGFSAKRGVAHPGLVIWLVVLGNAAALLRVVPLFFAGAEWAAVLLGLSGIVGWSAVLLLAVMVGKTIRSA